MRSEQRQAQLMAEASAPAPHDVTLAPNRRRHYDRQATVEKFQRMQEPIRDALFHCVLNWQLSGKIMFV